MKKIYFLSFISVLLQISLIINLNAQWIHTDIPYGGSVSSFAVLETKIFAGSDSGVFISSNDGLSWSAMDSGLTNLNITCLLIIDTNLFAGTNSGVFFSNDYGTNWSKVFSIPIDDLFWSTAINSLFFDGSNLFAGTEGSGIFRSTNKGLSWQKVLGLRSGFITSFAVSGTNLYAGAHAARIVGSYGGVFHSTNSGDNWIEVSDGLGGIQSVQSLIVNETELFAATYNGVYFTRNHGVHWTAANTGLTDTFVYSLAKHESKIFAGTYSGVFVSTNKGMNWSPINNGLINTTVYAFAFKDSNIFIGTGNGVWKRSVSEVDMEVIENETPSHFVLEQNYPNPFNSSTAILFSLPEAQNAELKIFDVLGNEIFVLLNEFKSAGEHKVEFDGSGLSSGIYFYQLKAGDFIQTKKLVLLR